MSLIKNRLSKIIKKHCDKTAIVTQKNKYSYSDIDKYSEKLKKIILDLKINKKTPIFLLLPRSALSIIGMITAYKCDTFFIPLDPKNPKQIIIDQLSSFGKAIVITTIDYTSDFLEEIWCNEDIKISFTNQYNEKLVVSYFDENDINLDDLAYAMYTSGSTGNPKCVLISQLGVLRLITNTNYIKIKSTDKILQFAPITFDASTFEIWGALLNGATLYVYESTHLDIEDLNYFVNTNKITIMWLTSALFHLLIRNRINIFSNLNVVLSGGDIINPDAIHHLIKTYPHLTFINGYGPTENTTFTCCHVINKNNLPTSNVPIGKAITGTSIYICNEDGNEVKDGEIGELYTGGSGLSLGYCFDIERTKNSFITNYSGTKERIYKTGDLVIKNKEGNLEFIGRVDNQVKVRGYRLSIEEVQYALNNVFENLDTIVGVIKDELDENILIAFILLNDNNSITKRSIKRDLMDNIPHYMIPDIIEFCNEFPITPNGKVDKKALLKSYIKT